MQPEINFAKRVSVMQVEEGDQLAPKFDDKGFHGFMMKKFGLKDLKVS